MLYQAMDNQKEEAQALITLANLQVQNQMLAEAMRSGKEALALCQEVGYRQGQANAFELMAHLHSANGNLPEATKVADEIVKVCQKGGDDSRSDAACYQVAAEVHLQLANANKGGPQSSRLVREGKKSAEAALKLMRSLSDKQGIVSSLLQLAQANLYSGNMQEVLKSGQESSALCKELQDSHSMANSILLCAQASLGLHDAQTAMQQAREAADIFQQLGDNAGSESAMEVHKMAQESLQDQRAISSSRPDPRIGNKDISGAKGHSAGIRPPVDARRGVEQTDAFPLRSGRGSAPNGTRRGGLGFNSFGRNPFEIH